MGEQRQLTAPEIDPTKRYIMCSICGWLVPEDEITLEFDGLYANYKNRSIGNWHLTVCEHCRLKLEEIEQQGEQAALMRMGKTGVELL
jgi:hypothetical protein